MAKLEPGIQEGLAHYHVVELRAWISDLPESALKDLEHTYLKMYAEEIERLVQRMDEIVLRCENVVKQHK